MNQSQQGATGERRRFGVTSASGVALASAVAAVAGIVILFIASHSLSKQDNSEFLSFWAALFFMYGVVGGIQTETTRAASRSSSLPVCVSPSLRFPRLITVGAISGGVLALLVLAVSPLLISHVFLLNSPIIVTGLILTAVLYSCHCVLAGSLQGSGEWTLYGRFLMLEALLRLTTIGTAAAWSLGLAGLEVACLFALLAWVILLASSRVARRSLDLRADVPLLPMLKQTFHSVVSSVASAALIVAFPLLIKLTTPHSVFEQSAPLLLAISMTRAPIMVPLQAFQGFAIAYVVKAGSKGWRALQKPILVILGVGSAGAILAYLLGPQLMLLFGAGYEVSGGTLALLTLAAAIMAVLTLTGTAALATGHHRAFSSGWAVSAIVAFAVLLLPLPLDTRCIASLTAGPLVGIFIHVSSLVRSGTRRLQPNLASEINKPE